MEVEPRRSTSSRKTALIYDVDFPDMPPKMVVKRDKNNKGMEKDERMPGDVNARRGNADGGKGKKPKDIGTAI